MSSQMFSKKDFSLSQYYDQLQKYESGPIAGKRASLKKDNSLSSFSKDHSKVSTLSKTLKEPFNQERSRLGITDKNVGKTGVDKVEMGRFQRVKKATSPVDHFKANSYLAESLNSSNITKDKWSNDSRVEDKGNLQKIPFSCQDQQKFVEHCSRLYNIKGQESIVSDIAKEINKRDEVYEVVTQNFGAESSEGLASRVKTYFKEHELMAKVIEEFKSISKLEIEDLNQLYYFLKSDR